MERETADQWWRAFDRTKPPREAGNARIDDRPSSRCCGVRMHLLGSLHPSPRRALSSGTVAKPPSGDKAACDVGNLEQSLRIEAIEIH